MTQPNSPTPQSTASGAAQIKAGKSAPKKPPYKGYTVKEKWFPCLLLSLFAPLTLCFFGPFEIYANNMAEFKFVLWDFWVLCGVIAVAAAGVLFGLLMLLRGRAFDVVFGIILGLSLMCFIQGNYLSLGADSLEGDGVGEGISILEIVINLLVWILVLAASVVAMLLLNRYRDTVRLIATVAVVALVGMTVISFAVISLTTDVYAAQKEISPDDMDLSKEVLTVKNLDTLATKDNIVIFIVDRFDYEYFDTALRNCPEVFDGLDGFIHFQDYVTTYPRTYPGVPHIVTGVGPDFSVSRPAYMKDAYGASPYLSALKDEGFDINVYTDSFYGYENAVHMRPFVSNTSGNVSYKIIDRGYLSLDMIRISLYRYVPFLVRHTLGNVSTPMYDKYVEYEMEQDVFRTDMKDVYEELTDEPFTFREAERGVSYVHIAGCHMPTAYNTDFEKANAEERRDTNVAMKVSFKIIDAYINEMKRMGVYEDATIIILGDHCNIGSDTELPARPHVTALLAKPAGVSEGDMTTSSAQLSPDDIFATVLSAAGSDQASDYGVSIFDVPEGEDRTRYYHFQMVEGTLYEGTYKNAIFEIVGSARDMDNWHLVRVDDLHKNIYD